MVLAAVFSTRWAAASSRWSRWWVPSCGGRYIVWAATTSPRCGLHRCIIVFIPVLSASSCHYLTASNRIPEAGLMARSYLPSNVSEIVAIWRKDHSKVSPKAADSLEDPAEYPNLFEDWQVALAVEKNVVAQRGHCISTDEYLNHATKSDITLVEAFKRMQVIEDEEQIDSLDENGEPDEEGLHLHHASYP